MEEAEPNIPERLRPIWNELKEEVEWLHLHWNTYRQLFGRSPKRIELLNESGATPFRVLQDVLLHEVMLGLCRITDPAKAISKKEPRDNASLEQLIDNLRDELASDLLVDLQVRLDAINAQMAPFRKHRNRRIAHRDLQSVLKAEEDPLPGVSRAQIESVLDSLCQFMNRFYLYFTKGTIGFQYIEPHVEPLVNTLKQAAAYRNLEREHVAQFLSWSKGEYGDA
jgi:hypothetical protein